MIAPRLRSFASWVPRPAEIVRERRFGAALAAGAAFLLLAKLLPAPALLAICLAALVAVLVAPRVRAWHRSRHGWRPPRRIRLREREVRHAR